MVGAVGGRIGVGHGADRADAPGRGRRRAAGNGFLMGESRFAQVGVDIDKAGGDDQSLRLEDRRIRGRLQVGPLWAMRPWRMRTSPGASVLLAGSTMRPRRTRRSAVYSTMD